MTRKLLQRSVIALVIVALAAALLILDDLEQPTNPVTPSPSAETASWAQFYFTSPQYPDDPARHRGGIDERLVGLIDRAQKTLDVADYDFDLKNVAEAMARAKGRGVRVRMVTDTDTLTNRKDENIQAAFKILRTADIPVVDDKRPSIMHNKFTVVDGEWVSTGSWNYTDGDTYHLNNWMGIFHAPELAANYTAEFEQMFTKQKFGRAKTLVTPNPDLTIDGHTVHNCFSPKGNCASLIVDTIASKARQSIVFLAFSFTHDDIGEAMINRAKAGVSVQGVFETTGSQTPFSEYGRMKKAGLDVYTDGNPWTMHHKVIVVDNRYLIAGSFNFSKNANEDNDENLLIIDDPATAQQFTAEFQRVLDQAKNPPPRKGSSDDSGEREKE